MALSPAVLEPGRASLGPCAAFLVAFAIVTLAARPAFGRGRRPLGPTPALDRAPTPSH